MARKMFEHAVSRRPSNSLCLHGDAHCQFRRLISSVFRHCVRASVSVLIPFAGTCYDPCTDTFFRQPPDLVARDSGNSPVDFSPLTIHHRLGHVPNVSAPQIMSLLTSPFDLLPDYPTYQA